MLHRCILQHTLWEYCWFFAHFPRCKLMSLDFLISQKRTDTEKWSGFLAYVVSKRSKEEHDPAQAPPASTVLPHQSLHSGFGSGKSLS